MNPNRLSFELLSFSVPEDLNTRTRRTVLDQQREIEALEDARDADKRNHDALVGTLRSEYSALAARHMDHITGRFK